jgi:hypothetical protein
VIPMPTTTAVNACPICASGVPDSLRESGNVKGHALKRCPGCELRRFDPLPDDATLADTEKQGYDNAWGLHC